MLKQKWLLLGLLATVFGMAAEQIVTKNGAQAGTQWIPHLSANQQFKSSIFIRSDEFDQMLTIDISFFDVDGQPAMVNFDDNGSANQTQTGLSFSLAPQSTRAIQLNSVTGGDDRSLQAKIVATKNDGTPGNLVALEAAFTGFSDGVKTAKVGVNVAEPTSFFKMNVNAASDPFSGAVELRGLAITNADAENACDCLVSLVGQDGQSLLSQQVQIQPYGKWLGVVSDMFPNATPLLEGGVGHLQALCSESVAVLALSFEGATITTVPTTQYNFDP